MKKMCCILSLLLLMILVVTNAVFAASVVGTPHDITQLEPAQGTCSVCHIPHKSPGSERLWAQPMGGGAINVDGIVGRLCFACHSTGGVYGNSTTGSVPQAGYAGQNVFPSTNGAHGLNVSGYVTDGVGSAGADEVDAAALTLPYAPAGDNEDTKAAVTNMIQCTTCHNVHDNSTNRPFLRRNIRDLCINCHNTRYTSDGATWTYGNSVTLGTWAGFGLNNLGSHPVGTNISGDIDGNDSPIITFNFEFFREFDDNGADGAAGTTDGGVTYGDNTGLWNLGRHSASNAAVLPGVGNAAGEGVVCVSCHAVHGVQDDTDPSTPIQLPAGNLLAVTQSPGTMAINPQAYNGDNYAANFLCESCHHNSDAAAAWANPAAWSTAGNFTQNDTTAYAGTHWPNPGATPYSHPIDDATIVNDAVDAFPADWPKSSYLAASVGNAPICESCHIPHPARALQKSRVDIDVIAGAGEFLLRNNHIDICARCHTSALAEHHPISGGNPARNMPNLAGVDIPGTGADDGRIGDSDDMLECADCHNATAAHNWLTANGVGLDPDWEPADNGRSDVMATDRLAANASRTCEQCHYRLRTGANIDPNILTPTHNATDEWASETEFQKDGLGTHFLGDVTAANIDWTTGSTTGAEGTFNPTTTAWPGGGWSRWDALLSDNTTAATEGQHLVCESCHELEPDKNINGSKLLLFAYAEGETVTANDPYSYFCEGCHTHDGPANTHPLTANFVSRTGNQIDTNSAYLDINAPTALGGYTTYPPANNAKGTPGEMSCDSCHQVHDASTNSATYILDAPPANVANPDALFENDRGEPVLTLGGGHINHPRGNLDVDYTQFCEQCHMYTK